MSDVKLATDKTWIPLGVAIGGLASVVMGAVWVSSSFQDLSYSNKDLANSVKRVESTLDRLLADGVSNRQAQQWIELFRLQNPTVKVPDLPR
jgi:hypothetical protein